MPYIINVCANTCPLKTMQHVLPKHCGFWDRSQECHIDKNAVVPTLTIFDASLFLLNQGWYFDIASMINGEIAANRITAEITHASMMYNLK